VKQLFAETILFMLIIQEKRDRQRPWQRAVPVPGVALSSSRTGEVAKQAGVPDRAG
jgi:hypothetical protein